jgi:hypothetical protein
MPKNASRRTFQQVHRDSKPIGSVEAGLWKPTDMGARDRALEAARLYELAHKRKGRRNGPLGHVGLEVLRALWNVVDFSTGRLEPSLQWLMEVTGRCRDAVVTGLKRLARCGFVHWSRRFEYTGERGFRTPQVKQVPNAYALTVPEDAAALVPARVERAEARSATPADYRLTLAHRLKVAMSAATRPYRADHYRDPSKMPLSKSLKRLGEMLAESESVMPDQTRRRYI